MLDTASPVPLYQQLADELHGQIRAGKYAAGARIPSEHELAAHYRLGRPTVRQATGVLVRRRILTRRRGAGTFVADTPPVADLFSLGGTLDAFRRGGVEPQVRLARKPALRRIPPDAAHPFAGRRVYSLERVSSVRRKPVLLERLYFDPAVFPSLDTLAASPESSLSQLVEQHYGLVPRGGRQTFRVHEAPAALARIMRLAPATPLLLVQRTLDFPRAAGAIFAELWCHTGQFVFAQTLPGLPGDMQHA